MKNYGNTGQAVTCVNEPTFEGFVTKSGRTIEDDLARARAPFVSPIKLQPLTPAAERALISGSTPARRSPTTPRPARRKPAQPARLPVPRPAARQRPVEVMTPRSTSAGGGQTTSTAPKGPQGTTRDAVLTRHRAGYTVTEICRELFLADQSVRYHLRKAGLTANRRRRDATPTIPKGLAEFVLARMGWSEDVMRRVAGWYSDHPDYKQSWRFNALDD